MDSVLEIGGYAAGYCGRLYVRAGSAVQRVEQTPPPAWASQQAMELFLHYGKQAREVADTKALADLANNVDVVICEAHTADELVALGFDTWAAPVKIAVTPFGRTGEKRNWQATPHTLLAMGGYTYLMGDPNRAPLSLPGHYLEFCAGTLAYMTAHAVRLNGVSKSVDLSLLETVMSLSQFTTVRWHCAGEIRQRHGNDFWFVEPSNLFACADGWVYLNIVPAFWDPLTVFLEQPELLLDPRFVNNDMRMLNRAALHTIVADFMAPLLRADLVARAERCRIPLGEVLSFEEVLADPHLDERDFFEKLNSEKSNGYIQYLSPGNPYRLFQNVGPTP